MPRSTLARSTAWPVVWSEMFPLVVKVLVLEFGRNARIGEALEKKLRHPRSKPDHELQAARPLGRPQGTYLSEAVKVHGTSKGAGAKAAKHSAPFK